MTLPKVLDLVRKFRKTDSKTPIVLMGYYNPIHAYGTARFAKDAAEAGVDGLIIVDLPPEEDEVLRVPAAAHGIDIIRLAHADHRRRAAEDRPRWRERLSLLRLDRRHHRHQELSTEGDVRAALSHASSGAAAAALRRRLRHQARRNRPATIAALRRWRRGRFGHRAQNRRKRARKGAKRARIRCRCGRILRSRSPNSVHAARAADLW